LQDWHPISRDQDPRCYLVKQLHGRAEDVDTKRIYGIRLSHTMQSKLGFLKKNSAMDVGHAGVRANSQLTLRVDQLMKPVSVAESTAIGAACHSL
jgi:hypothetical protein